MHVASFLASIMTPSPPPPTKNKNEVQQEQQLNGEDLIREPRSLPILWSWIPCIVEMEFLSHRAIDSQASGSDWGRQPVQFDISASQIGSHD